MRGIPQLPDYPPNDAAIVVTSDHALIETVRP
jgi:hypothetical protein